MKKTLKITAFIILIVSLFSLSGYAQEKTIEWDSGYDYTETYSYGGELKLGNNKITPVNQPNRFDSNDFFYDSVYYEFNVEKSGYYSIDILGDLYATHYMPAVSQDIRDGVVYGEKNYLYLDDSCYSVYLEEGNCVFGVDYFIYEPAFRPDDDYGSELKIAFVAEEITDVQIEEEYLEDIIFDCHIYPEYDENNTSRIPAKGKVVFSNGKEYEFDQYIDIKYSDDIAPGENKISVVVQNFTKEYTVQIKTVDDYIKNIEIGNPEEVAVVTKTFIPDVIYTPDEYIDLILTKPDGTKITEEVYYFYDIELKGDKVLTVWCDYYQKDDGKWYLVVEAAGKEYLSIPCESVPASLLSNCALYYEGIVEYTVFMLEETSAYFTDAFDLFSGMSMNERAECFSDAFAVIKDYYSEIRNLTELFMDFAR